MTKTISPNTQAILLLTAPLIAGRGSSSAELLSPGEYKRLARHLRENQRQPSDLMSPDADEIYRTCQPVVEEERLKRLLERGFLLSQVVDRWETRAIWVVSRADPAYPKRLKSRLREDAPAILYGCGDRRLLDTGGLAVVGSRRVEQKLIDYAMAVGRLSARARHPLISGGAKGIDQAAMRGALEEGGAACGVLADSLEQTAMTREHRNLLLDGQLVLVSPYDPSAGFHVGQAMQRNKLIYALAHASLVVNADLNKGGTWAGAIEQLNKLRFVSVYVRTTGEPSAGLEALREKGALPWPEPQDVAAFNAAILVTPPEPLPTQIGLELSSHGLPRIETIEPKLVDDSELRNGTSGSSELFVEEVPSDTHQSRSEEQTPHVPQSPAETLFNGVRHAVLILLQAPMKNAEIAATLGVSKAQAKAWLQRLIEEGVLEKSKKPAGFVVKESKVHEAGREK